MNWQVFVPGTEEDPEPMFSEAAARWHVDQLRLAHTLAASPYHFAVVMFHDGSEWQVKDRVEFCDCPTPCTDLRMVRR